MKTPEALAILAKLWELETIAQKAITPDGRWQLLQDWLRDNPTWEKQVNQWLRMTPDEATVALELYITTRAVAAGMPLVLVNAFINDNAKDRARATIETFQTLYRERKQADKQTRKEIAK